MSTDNSLEVVDYVIDTASKLNERSSMVSGFTSSGNVLAMLNSIKGGKKLRSVATVLISDSLGGNQDVALDFGLVVELIHQASLVHDDIIDKDDFRRGKPTLFSLIGSEKALLGGDAIIATAFRMFSEVPPAYHQYGTKIVGKGLMRFVEGASEEMNENSMKQMDSYMKIINLKTATLFQVACELGAVSAYDKLGDKVDDYRDIAKKYGDCIGMAFQLTDDLSDLYTTMKVDKPVGDIANRRMTLPVIIAIENKEDYKNLRKYYENKSMSEKELIQLVKWLNDKKYIEAAEAVVSEFLDKAHDHSTNFPDSKFKNILGEFPSYSVELMRREVGK